MFLLFSTSEIKLECQLLRRRLIEEIKRGRVNTQRILVVVFPSEIGLDGHCRPRHSTLHAGKVQLLRVYGQFIGSLRVYPRSDIAGLAEEVVVVMEVIVLDGGIDQCRR